MSKVRFKALNSNDYNSIRQRDNNTLYFIEDEHTIAKGNNRFLNVQPITYSQLVELRDNFLLKDGCLYQITDYVTTVKEGSQLQTAHRPFSIFVFALDYRTLSEDALAFDDGRSDYWSDCGCNLSAWRLRYCLDNDTTRFDWADNNGKGVIYGMEDEWGNRCPYDFKNIFFEYGVHSYYTFSPKDGSEDLSVTSRGAVKSNVIESIFDKETYIIPRSVFFNIGDELLNCHIASPGVWVDCGGTTRTHLTVCVGNDGAHVDLRADHVIILPGLAGQNIPAYTNYEFWGPDSKGSCQHRNFFD